MDFIMRYWVEALCGLVSGALALGGRWLWGQVKRDRADSAALRTAMQALLRAEIISSYNHYEDRGHLPIYARENLHSLYTQYKYFGGNGAIDGLIEIAGNWPTSPDDERQDL